MRSASSVPSPTRRGRPPSSASRRRTPKSSASKNGASPSASLSDDRLLAMWRRMLLIRRFEEKAGQLYGMGKIGGFCHLYIGQEAVVCGVHEALSENDNVVTSYRDHGQILASGEEPRRVMAELTGRAGGVSKGKGGSMHMFSPERNFYGGHGIVGAQVPLGVGLSLAESYRGGDGATVVYFGEGASNQGQVYESFNMASLWKLPTVFVIENNRYAMGTSVERGSANARALYSRGAAFGIRGEQVDGMDAIAVYESAAAALARCRSGGGPQILEMMTYRYRGHSMSDPAKYRTREEVDAMREKRDPIERLAKRLKASDILSEATLKKENDDVRSVIEDAAEFALADSLPDDSELHSDVYAPSA